MNDWRHNYYLWKHVESLLIIDWVQVRVYSGFSITCGNCRVHGRSSYCSLSATTQIDSRSWTFHTSSWSCVGYALCFYSNSSGIYIRQILTKQHLTTCYIYLSSNVHFSSTTVQIPDTTSPSSIANIYIALNYLWKINKYFLFVYTF